MPDNAMADRVCLSLVAAAENTATRALLFNSSEAAINTVITERVIRRAIPLLFPVKRTVIKDLVKWLGGILLIAICILRFLFRDLRKVPFFKGLVQFFP
jgi:hypothetical protein